MSGYNAGQAGTFFDAYLTTALWSTTDDDGNPLDDSFDVSDISDDTKTRLAEDVLDFLTANADDLAQLDPGAAGHDFWLSRNGHGTGFWDRGLGDLGDRLHAAAKVYGSVDLLVTSDGKVETH